MCPGSTGMETLPAEWYAARGRFRPGRLRVNLLMENEPVPLGLGADGCVRVALSDVQAVIAILPRRVGLPRMAESPIHESNRR